MREITKILCYLSLTVILFSINYVQSEEIPNYCLDEETNEKWQSIAKRNASNTDVINLYRLRKELCRQVVYRCAGSDRDF